MRRYLGISAVLFSGLLILSGCGSSEPDQATETAAAMSGLNLKAEVDPEAGTVVLPPNRYAPTVADEDLVSEAWDVAMTTCARDAGISWPAVVRSEEQPTDSMFYQYGPWTEDMAAKFAFVMPQSDDSLIRNGFMLPPEGYEPPNHPEPSDEQLDAGHNACLDNSDVEKFTNARSDIYSEGPWWGELSDAGVAATESPEATKVFDDLKVCYADAGLTYDDERPGFVVGAQTEAASTQTEVDGDILESNVPSDVITEEQVEMALKVADCHQQVDSVSRLANITAEYEASIIEKYADELEQSRKDLDALLDEAKEYIAAHPEAFE